MQSAMCTEVEFYVGMTQIKPSGKAQRRHQGNFQSRSLGLHRSSLSRKKGTCHSFLTRTAETWSTHSLQSDWAVGGHTGGDTWEEG